jgi:hypothetical protein
LKITTNQELQSRVKIVWNAFNEHAKKIQASMMAKLSWKYTDCVAFGDDQLTMDLVVVSSFIVFDNMTGRGKVT